MERETDAHLAALVETVEFFIAKLRRFTAGVTVEEMQWTPSGINNSLAWIVRHCADLLWLMYGRLSGNRIPVDLGASGIAWGSVQGAIQDNIGAAFVPGADKQAILDEINAVGEAG